MYLHQVSSPRASTLTAGWLPARDESCGFEGDPDLYGLGIRVGIYLQWISAFVIYWLHSEGRRELQEAYVIFLFSIFIAIIVITARAEPTYTAEILVLTYIIFGGTFIILSIGTRSKHLSILTKSTSVHIVRQCLTLGLLTGSAIYCSWFWLRGMYGEVFLETPCGTFGFLFAKVSLYDQRVTRFFAALSIIVTVAWARGLAQIVWFILRWLWTRRKQVQVVEQQSHSKGPLTQPTVAGSKANLELSESEPRITETPPETRRDIDYTYAKYFLPSTYGSI